MANEETLTCNDEGNLVASRIPTVATNIEQREVKNVNYIYSITNTINNKRYIGKTGDPITRKRKHKEMLRSNRHHNKYLQNSYNKNGEDAFAFKVLAELEAHEDWEECEKQTIQKLKSMYHQHGYNISEGGEGGASPEMNYNNKISNQARVSDVLQIDMNTLEVVNIFPSINEASKETGVWLSAISASCNRQKMQASGYYWVFSEDFTVSWKPTLDKRSKPVAIVDANGKFLQLFPTIRICAQQMRLNISVVKERIEKNEPVRRDMELKCKFISHEEYYSWNPESCID